MLKSKKHIWGLVAVLIMIDQGIKLIINSKYLEANLPIIQPWVYFRPMFNRDYSWLNSMFQLGIGKWIHIAVVVGMLVAVVLLYKHLYQASETSRLIDSAFIFIVSGATCSLLDKVFWDGSLDFIFIRGFFTFDLKDVYINVFIGLLLYMVLINHKGIRDK